MTKSQFSLKNCKDVLLDVCLQSGVTTGGTVPLQYIHASIATVTKKTHPYFLKQFVEGMEMIGMIKIEGKEAKIIIEREELS